MKPDLSMLSQAVASAAERYTRLVLLAGTKGSGKTTLLKAYAQEANAPYIPVGALMAERLLATSPRFRDTEAERVLKEICQAPGPVLLDNLELLFAPDLRLDPYRLLVGLARTRIVVAAWAGTYQNGILTYAASGHKEYRTVTAADAICIPL